MNFFFIIIFVFLFFLVLAGPAFCGLHTLLKMKSSASSFSFFLAYFEEESSAELSGK